MADLDTAITPAPQVTCFTKGQQVASGYTGNVTMALVTNPTGATLSGTLTVAATAGVATFSNLKLDRSGKGFTLRSSGAAQAGQTPRSIISRPFDIATKLVFTTQPVGAEPDEVMPAVIVESQDSDGNTDANYTGNVTISIYSASESGVLSGTLTVAAVAGVATFSDLSIDVEGDYTFLAEGGESP